MATIPAPGQAAGAVPRTRHGCAGSLGLGLPQSHSAGHVPTEAAAIGNMHRLAEESTPKLGTRYRKPHCCLRVKMAPATVKCWPFSLASTSSIEECVMQLKIFFQNAPGCSHFPSHLSVFSFPVADFYKRSWRLQALWFQELKKGRGEER